MDPNGSKWLTEVHVFCITCLYSLSVNMYNNHPILGGPNLSVVKAIIITTHDWEW